ncbi:MAG: NHLP-related RiPP peptide [Rhizobium sp.]|nr:NHLP-related RiPP peptide [Rhizobium sp.]
MSLGKEEKDIDMLLGKLGNDDTFRKAFSRNPRAALASIGLAAVAAGWIVPTGSVNAGEIHERTDGTVQLASKEAFLKARDTLRAEQKSPFEPINLDFNGRSKGAD